MQLKLDDAIFICWNSKGRLRDLPINATEEDIMTTDDTTPKVDNQKNE